MATWREARDKWLEGANGDGGSVSCLRGEEDEEEEEEEEWTVSKGNFLLRAMAKMMNPYPEPSDADSDVEACITRSGRSTRSNSNSSTAETQAAVSGKS